MKNVLKLGAVVLAIVMVLSMSVTAFATEPTPATLTNGTVGTTGTALADGISIPKTIVFVNDESTTVREPNITYEYTVAAVTVNSTAPTVSDGTTTAVVNSGVIGANTNTDHKASVVFADTNTVAAVVSTGTADTKNFTLTFDASQFTHAGIYRYSVTESIASGSKTKANVGVTEAATYSNVRYLDVYVENGDSGLQIYGYVLFESSDATTQNISSGESAPSKSNGWVDTDTNTSDTVHADVDVYKTHNIQVTKATTGSLADKTHRFNFDAVVTSTGVDGSTKLDVATTGAATTTPSSDTVGSYISGATATYSFELKDGENATIKGIPETASVVVTETNDSVDTYSVTATSTVGSEAATTVFTKASKAPNATAATSSVSITDKTVIAFTNELIAVSPTGVVLRVAPYALMLGVGLFLVLFSRRRKNRAEA